MQLAVRVAGLNDGALTLPTNDPGVSHVTWKLIIPNPIARMQMRRAIQLSLAICVAALNACGGGSDSTTGTDGGIYSDYVLQTVNGSALPALIDQSASAHTFIHSADIRLSANGTFSDLRSTTLTDALGDHAANVTRTGTFVVTGATVTLNYQDAFGNNTGGDLATMNGKVITKIEGANTFSFSR